VHACVGGLSQHGCGSLNANQGVIGGVGGGGGGGFRGGGCSLGGEGLQGECVESGGGWAGGSVPPVCAVWWCEGVRVGMEALLLLKELMAGPNDMLRECMYVRARVCMCVFVSVGVGVPLIVCECGCANLCVSAGSSSSPLSFCIGATELHGTTDTVMQCSTCNHEHHVHL